MVFVISPPFILIIITSFCIETEKVMYCLIFSPKQVNCPSNSSSSSYEKMIIIVRSIVRN